MLANTTIDLKSWEDAILGAIPLLQLIIAYISGRRHKNVQNTVSDIQTAVNGRLDQALQEIERLKAALPPRVPIAVIPPQVVPAPPTPEEKP